MAQGKISADDYDPQKHVAEYKRTCSECGTTWHSLVGREKELARHNCAEGLLVISSSGSTRAQYDRNFQVGQEKLGSLHRCPQCGSENYEENIIYYEKRRPEPTHQSRDSASSETPETVERSATEKESRSSRRSSKPAHSKLPKDAKKHATEAVQLGNKLLCQQEYSRAIQSYARAIELNPADVYAYYGCALAYHRLGNLEAACSHMRRAKDLGWHAMPPWYTECS